MLPLGHAAFAYLWYAAVAAVVTRRPPVGAVLVPLLFASQLPDLIDKPLVFVGLLPSGRSLGHSLFALVVLSLAVALLARAVADGVEPGRVSRGVSLTPLAFGVGYASHLVADAYGPLYAGNLTELSFLFFPFVSVPQYPRDAVAPWIRLRRIYATGPPDELSPLVAAAVGLFVAAQLWAYLRRRERVTR